MIAIKPFRNILVGEKITVFDLNLEDSDIEKHLEIDWTFIPIERDYGIHSFELEILLINGNIENEIIYIEKGNQFWKVNINRPKYLKSIYIKDITIEMEKKLITISF